MYLVIAILGPLDTIIAFPGMWAAGPWLGVSSLASVLTWYLMNAALASLLWVASEALLLLERLTQRSERGGVQ